MKCFITFYNLFKNINKYKTMTAFKIKISKFMLDMQIQFFFLSFLSDQFEIKIDAR